jgi:hypothetical protein
MVFRIKNKCDVAVKKTKAYACLFCLANVWHAPDKNETDVRQYKV